MLNLINLGECLPYLKATGVAILAALLAFTFPKDPPADEQLELPLEDTLHRRSIRYGTYPYGGWL